MKFPTEQTDEVKTWVIGRIENISDADPDVLAEYVLAILKSDVPDEEVRAQMLEHLPDFLNEHTLQFVDEVFARYATEPTATAAAATSAGLGSPIYSPPNSPIPIKPHDGKSAGRGTREDDAGSRQMRKRSYQEFNDQARTPTSSSRASKSSRPGKGTRERRMLPQSQQYLSPASHPTTFHTQPFSNFPRPPTPPPGFPAFDPADPMASFMAMQAMFPHMTGITSQSRDNREGNRSKRRRCHDYDHKGFCVRGSSCPFDHGNNHIVASRADEYDPMNAMIETDSQPNGLSRSQTGPVQGKRDFRRSAQAAFSDHRLPQDRSITAIVVEPIPEENFDEQSVRHFFEQFGSITEITMHAYKYLAIVKYDTRPAAQRAWQSPKPIFNNRFVNVYWYRPDLDVSSNTTGTAPQAGSPLGIVSSVSLDSMTREERAAYERRLEEKQQAHEQRQEALRNTQKAKEALTRRKEEVTAKYESERAVLRAKLAAKGRELPANVTEEVSSEALALREQLARLEAEARAMGIDPSAPAEEPTYTHRGRGRGRRYSSRGAYSGLGRGFTQYQPAPGSYRGSPFVRGRSSAVRKLDNRPRKIAVSGVEFNAQKEEMLRAYLVSGGEFESIEKDAERTDTFIISFKERWQADQVMKGLPDVVGIGKLHMAWVASAPMTTTELPTLDQEDEGQAEVPNGHSSSVRDDTHHELEVNLDVAGGDDEWDNIS